MIFHKYSYQLFLNKIGENMTTTTRPDALTGPSDGERGHEQPPKPQDRAAEAPVEQPSDIQVPPEPTQTEHSFLRRHWKVMTATGAVVLPALGIGIGVARSNGLGDGTSEKPRPTAFAPAVPGVSPSTVEAPGATAPNTEPAARGEFDPDKVAALSPEGIKQLFSVKPGHINPKNPTSYTNIFAHKFCGAIEATVNQKYTKPEDFLTTGSPDENGFPSTEKIFKPAILALTGGLDITKKNPALVNYVNSQTERVWYAAVAAMGAGKNTGQVVGCTVDPSSVTENTFTFTVEEKSNLSEILPDNAQQVRYTAEVYLGDHLTDGGRVKLTALDVKNR